MHASSAVMTAAVFAGRKGRQHWPMHPRMAPIDSPPAVRVVAANDLLLLKRPQDTLPFPAGVWKTAS